MRILVAGAGIGGLATAAALREAGYDAHVIERAPKLTEVGAGVGLQPHAMRCLDHLGATQRLSHISYPDKISFRDMIEGEQVYETTLGRTAEQLYGHSFGVVHRRDLIDALAELLPEDALHLSCEIVGAEEDDKGVRVKTADGGMIEGDLLVGADGLQSTIRSLFFGDKPRVFTGYLAWRTVFDAERLSNDPADTISIWLGSGRHVISYPIRDRSQIYAGCYVPADEALLEDWSKSGDIRELRSAFEDACPDLRKLVASVDEAFITGIFYRSPLPAWTTGRVVLIGDAAHPVLPTSGSGAGMALEDAVALAACLRRHGDDHESAFEEFEARRKPRTSRVLAMSRADLAAFHEDDEDRRVMRGRIDAGVNRVDPSGEMRHSWLYCHDEVAESAKPIEQFMAEHGNPLEREEARRAFDSWRAAIPPEVAAEGWLAEREAYARFCADLSELPADVTREEVEFGGVAVTRIVPPDANQELKLVHFAGGGFAFDGHEPSVALAARIAQASGVTALVPHVCLSPEASQERQLAAALAAYRGMDARGVFLSGDGSGANLALRTAISLGADADARLLGLYLFSPFLDLSLSNGSIDQNAGSEAWLTRQRLLFMAAAQTQGADPADAAYSPVWGNLAGLPPVSVFAARQEALAGDAELLVRRIEDAGGAARLTLADDSVHSFALFDYLPEARSLVASVAAEIEAQRTALGLVG